MASRSPVQAFAKQDELIRRRPAIARAPLPGASHGGHLDAFGTWTRILREYLSTRVQRLER